MSCPRSVEHECSGSSENVASRVVISPFQNVDFLSKL